MITIFIIINYYHRIILL